MYTIPFEPKNPSSIHHSAAAALLLLGYLSASAAQLDSLVLLVDLLAVLWLHFALDLPGHQSESILDV